MSSTVSNFRKMCMSKNKGLDSEFNEFRLYRFFKLLACNRFRWEGLPDGIESRYIEEALFFQGECAFFENKKALFGMENTMNLKMALPCASNGNLNVYGEPLSLTVTGVNYQDIIQTKDCVRILSNDDAIPVNIYMNHYSHLLSRIEKTIDKNLKQQNFPFIVATSKNSQLTSKNIVNKMENDEEFIFTDEQVTGRDGDCGIKVMQTGAPYLLDKLQAFKNDQVNELLTFLGFNNTNTDKKERMLVDEVNVNNSHILMNLDIEYKNRKKAAEEINKKYGLNVRVIKVIDELQSDFFGSKQGDKKEDKKEDSWVVK